MSSGTKIYFDSCCFIDMVKHQLTIGNLAGREAHVFYCKKFLEAARAEELTVFASTLAVAECTHVKDSMQPQGKNVVLTDEVKRLLEGILLSAKSGVMPVQPTPGILKAARDLRWQHGATFKPMDSIHIATAIEMKCSHFVTTDSKLAVENSKIVSSLRLAICSADQIADLLPSKFRQLPLSPVIKTINESPSKA
jgi:predicted nucleic acid-binding protein